MHENDIEHIGWHKIHFVDKRFLKQILINFLQRFHCSVNSAFLTLRQLIPTEPKTRKLSKIETLRLAKSYIEHLFAMLITGNSIFTKNCLEHLDLSIDEIN